MSRTSLGQEQIVAIVREYREGWSIKRLVRKYRVTDRRIRNILVASGVPIRKPGKPVNVRHIDLKKRGWGK